MVFILIVIVSLGFGLLLHTLAKNWGCNPILWGSLGASFWFLPIPFLLLSRNRALRNASRNAL